MLTTIVKIKISAAVESDDEAYALLDKASEKIIRSAQTLANSPKLKVEITESH